MSIYPDELYDLGYVTRSEVTGMIEEALSGEQPEFEPDAKWIGRPERDENGVWAVVIKAGVEGSNLAEVQIGDFVRVEGQNGGLWFGRVYAIRGRPTKRRRDAKTVVYARVCSH